MKQLFTLAMFLMISAATFGQGVTVTSPQTYTQNLTYLGNSQYSSGGYNKLVQNSTTGRLEYTPNTLLQGKVVAVTEKDSARNYTHTGSYLTCIKWTVRDTVNLTAASYATNQVFKFTVVASGADTTVFVPNSGTIAGGFTYTMTGTNNSVSFWYDGTNYWITK